MPTTTRKKKTTRKGSSSGRVTAETLAKGQREISVSEFFAKNRHLLGFDNPRKAMGPAEEIDRYKRVFGVGQQQSMDVFV